MLRRKWHKSATIYSSKDIEQVIWEVIEELTVKLACASLLVTYHLDHTVYNNVYLKGLIHFVIQTGNYPNKNKTIFWNIFIWFRAKFKWLRKFAYLMLKTTLQNSFKNQRLIPLVIGVKKASGFKSCQETEVRIGCKDQSFCELQYRDRLFVDPFRK